MHLAEPQISGFRRIGEQTDILGECPLWDERRDALSWVDTRVPAVRRHDAARGEIDSWRCRRSSAPSR